MLSQFNARVENLTLISLIVVGMLSWGSVAHAIGRWNLPSTVPQYFGYGNGPGYHAPRVRMPGHRPPKVPRVVIMPSHDCSGDCDHGPVMPSDIPTDRLIVPQQVNTTTSDPTTFNPDQPAQSERQTTAIPISARVVSKEITHDPLSARESLLERLPEVSPDETSELMANDSPRTDREAMIAPQAGFIGPPGGLTQAPATLHEQSVQLPQFAQPPFEQPLNFWLAPVPLPVVTELPAKPVPPALFPPRGPLLEEPATARIEQPEEMKSARPIPDPQNSLFSAPPLPAYQG